MIKHVNSSRCLPFLVQSAIQSLVDRGDGVQKTQVSNSRFEVIARQRSGAHVDDIHLTLESAAFCNFPREDIWKTVPYYAKVKTVTFYPMEISGALRRLLWRYYFPKVHAEAHLLGERCCGRLRRSVPSGYARR